jgi:hypothetical protein
VNISISWRSGQSLAEVDGRCGNRDKKNKNRSGLMMSEVIVVFICL